MHKQPITNANTNKAPACGFIAVGVSLFLILIFGVGQIQASPSVVNISSHIQTRIEAAGATSSSPNEQALHAAKLVSHFYTMRSFSPAWLDEHGLFPHVEQLIHIIENAENEALNPEDYHLSFIRSLLSRITASFRFDRHTPLLAQLDILCTDAFLTYAAHIAFGRFNPKAIYKSWHTPNDDIDLIALLDQATESGFVELSLNNQRPKHAVYSQLREYLVRYRKIASQGGWATVNSMEKMQLGDKGPHVLQLRERLLVTGELSAFNNQNTFDETLYLAVIRFQASHGLNIDGTVGHKTLAALNISVEQRIRQIELNMERWRWLPQQLGDRYILVNITNFSLSLIENGYTAISMPVIVGRTSRSTPIFSARMTYFELNPYWRVPRSIAVKDKLPKIRRDSGYLSRHHFRLFQWFHGDAFEIDPHDVNWAGVTAKNFNYSLRQDPGPDNALGSLKFMFPNKFNVYMHDTPSQHLFKKNIRTFSSGCIRLASPIDLANYLLRNDPFRDPQAVMSSIENGVREIVSLPDPIRVYVLYWTAWVGEDGRIQFRDDIYNRDAVLTAAKSVTNVTDLIALSSSN